MDNIKQGRRNALMSVGLGLAATTVGLAGTANAAQTITMRTGADTLADLTARLSKSPRRRDFKTVPMILNDPDQWDQAAFSELIAYRGGPKQVWDNVDIAGPWLNLMRNSLNVQIWSFRHPNFLVVSATHATAHLALLEQAMWDKYQLGKLTGGNPDSNTLLKEQKAAGADEKDYENSDGAFSPHNNSIPALQRRGVVFVACHNAIWEVSEKLIAADVNPDKLSHEVLAAELTNHLIADAVLSPGTVGTLPEMMAAGFHYVK